MGRDGIATIAIVIEIALPQLALNKRKEKIRAPKDGSPAPWVGEPVIGVVRKGVIGAPALWVGVPTLEVKTVDLTATICRSGEKMMRYRVESIHANIRQQEAVNEQDRRAVFQAALAR